MGFQLLDPHYFSFHSSAISTRRHHRLLLPSLTTISISNRLFFITFITLTLLPIYGVLTVEPSPKQQQTAQDANGQQMQCETKALDDVPPDPVSKFNKERDGRRLNFN